MMPTRARKNKSGMLARNSPNIYDGKERSWAFTNGSSRRVKV
jgi:hypothetical protein